MFSNSVASWRIFNPSRCDIKYNFSAKALFILETVQTIIGALVTALHTFGSLKDFWTSSIPTQLKTPQYLVENLFCVKYCQCCEDLMETKGVIWAEKTTVWGWIMNHLLIVGAIRYFDTHFRWVFWKQILARFFKTTLAILSKVWWHYDEVFLLI